MVSSLLLVAALIVAPVIGGGFGELAAGIIQVLILAAAAWHVAAGHAKHSRLPGVAPLAVFLLLSIAAALFSESIYASLRQLNFVVACAAGYLLAGQLCRDRRVAAAAVWGVVASSLLICTTGIRDYAIGTGGGSRFWHALLSSGDHQRLFGPFINPNFFAGYLVLAIPVTLGAYMAARRSVWALAAGVAFVVEVLALMLTGTKFGVVGAGVGLVGFLGLALVTRSLTRPRLPRLLPLVIVMLPLLVVFSGPMRSRINAAEEGGAQVHSAAFRVYTWKGTLRMIRAHPVMGVGPGAYDVAYPRYSIAGPTKYAHQSYLQIAAENGIPAALAFFAVIVAVGYGAVIGVFKARCEPDSDTAEPSLGWEDLVPRDAWRLISCAICGALAGSAVRNLVDSDWYVIGIALPVSVLAGVLVARTSSEKPQVALSRLTRIGFAFACIVFILLSVSFGLGDWLASQAMPEVAALVSPLNPLYHREEAKRSSDREPAIRDLDTAIRLAPTDGANYYVKAMLAEQYWDTKTAISCYLKTLKCNPNSTQALYHLAMTYQAEGDTANCESTLRRLLSIEDSAYEQVKGVPEMVDTTYAYAHAYFARKYDALKDKSRAAKEWQAVVNRLDRWRSNRQMLEIARFTGALTKADEQQLLDLLQEARTQLRMDNG